MTDTPQKISRILGKTECIFLFHLSRSTLFYGSALGLSLASVFGLRPNSMFLVCPIISSTMRNTKIIGRRIPTTKSARSQSVAAQAQTQPVKLAPAVPIAIFRELSVDLQATQANINALQVENLQLAAQNQQLRHDLEQLAAQTQQVVQRFRHSTIGSATDEALMLDELGFDATSATTRSQMLDQLYRALPPDDAPVFEADAMVDATPLSSGWSAMPKLAMPRVKKFSVQAPPPYRSTSTTIEGDLNGWKLTLVMALIVLSAFGAGFLVVRPLLAPTPNR